MADALNFSNLWEDFLIAQDRFESALVEAMGDFGHLSHDPYDNSLEILGAPNETRLSEAAQRVIWDAGFRKAYVNHRDGWQTHYTWGAFKDPFRVSRGWRRKAKASGDGFLISYWPESWAKREWLETGYMVIVPDPLEASQGA